MKFFLYFLCISIFSIFLSVVPAYCEYNLATGKEENLFLSSKKEAKMGRSISKSVEKKFDLSENYTYQEKVGLIGQKLVDVCDRRDLTYYFKVIDEEGVDNAFALPGGYVYIFESLMEKMDTDDELAAVLAHEIGHICARHSAKRFQGSFGYQLLRILAVKGAESSQDARRINEALTQLVLSYSREDEFEADALAVRYLDRAGYDKSAVISMIDKLIEINLDGPIRSKRYWHTHPYLGARRSAAFLEITGQMDFDAYINVTDDEEYIN
ncbi:MAG: M48 family metalloprotease [Candidatus Omnitrophota bacterium]